MTQVAREKKIIPFDRPVHQDLGSPLVDHISMDGDCRCSAYLVCRASASVG